MAEGSDTLTPTSLREEHASLDGRLEALEKGLAASGGLGREELTQRLTELQRFLQRHFGREEDSPFYRELPLRQPHLTDRLTRLRNEHQEITEEITALCEAAGSSGSGSLEPEIVDRIRALTQRIRRHERDETEIVQRAWLEDYGEGD